MDRGTSKQILQSIVNFLRAELSGNCLESESAESVEVAVQCLETAYSLPCENLPILSLANIYREALANADVTEIQQSTSSSTTVSEESKAQAEQLKAQGNDYMGKEQYEVSAECYSKAIEKDPSNAVYYCNRAAAYSKLAKHDLAVSDCKKALQIQPQYSKAYGRMGLAYSSLNQHQEAKDCYKKALDLEPGNEGFARNLAIAEQAIQSSASQQTSANPLAGLMGSGGGLGSFGAPGGGGPDLTSLIANPNLMSMATQLMADPNMQNMMANILGNSGGAPAAVPTPPAAPTVADPPPPPPAGEGAPGGGGIEALFSAGRQLAEQMQNQHPELLAQIRGQMQGGAGQNNDQQQPPPQP